VPVPAGFRRAEQNRARALAGKIRYEVYIRDRRDTASVILAAMEKLGVHSVVIATQGRKGLGRLVLASVAERVVRESPCPVLSVRARAEKFMTYG